MTDHLPARLPDLPRPVTIRSAQQYIADAFGIDPSELTYETSKTGVFTFRQNNGDLHSLFDLMGRPDGVINTLGAQG